MAALSSKQRTEDWREKIKAANLTHRLVAHAKGEVELTNSQIKAIEILLKKVYPDLKSVEHKGEIDHNLTVNEIKVSIVDPKDTNKIPNGNT